MTVRAAATKGQLQGLEDFSMREYGRKCCLHSAWAPIGPLADKYLQILPAVLHGQS